MKIESDRAVVRSGIRHGRTLGSRSLLIENRDYANWEERMNPWLVDGEVDEVHLPRPGHARSRRHPEVRPHRRPQRPRAGQRARDRGTRRGGCSRKGVSAGARRLCAQPRAPDRLRHRAEPDSLGPADFAGVDASPVRCLDPKASDAMVAEIDTARKNNESLGGIFEVRAFGLVPGLGAYVSWEAASMGVSRERSCRSMR